MKRPAVKADEEWLTSRRPIITSGLKGFAAGG
jgi:hypothetical protein